MDTLTFREGLIREHKPEPLEGHTVVVLRRIGEAGERRHAVLEPGSDRVRGSLLASMFGKPETFVAFAVDEAHSRRLAWETHLRLSERAYAFHLGFALWYRAADPEALVAARLADPLGTVQRKVTERVVEEMGEQPWEHVWHAFRTTAEQVVRDTRPELSAFAHGYGMRIVELKLTARFDEGTIGKEETIRSLEDQADVKMVGQRADHRVGSFQRHLDREAALDIAHTDALRAERSLRHTAATAYNDRMGELLRTAHSAEDLLRVHRRLAPGGAGTDGNAPVGWMGVPRLAPGAGGAAATALPAGANGLSDVLGDVVAQSEALGDGQRRRIRAMLLELVAAMLADDGPATSEAQADRAQAVRGEVEAAQMDEEHRGALLTLADPEALRPRLYP